MVQHTHNHLVLGGGSGSGNDSNYNSGYIIVDNSINVGYNPSEPISHITTTGYELTNEDIANLNPFRYRGYYYDTEIDLYYLNSRYYDPELGRFINSDDISVLDITNVALNGLNLYAYCLNNPVNEVDENGYFLLWLFITAIIVGSIVSAGISIVSQWITNGWNSINWAQVGWSALMGSIGGALSVSGLGVVGMSIAGAGLGLVSSVGSNIIGGNDFTDWHTWGDIVASAMLGMLFGRLGGAGATNKGLLDNAVRNSTQFAKAALSYDKVLTKIATGSYKNLAGAAGARAITSRTLQSVWQSVVKKVIFNKTFSGFGLSSWSNFIDTLITKIFV